MCAVGNLAIMPVYFTDIYKYLLYISEVYLVMLILMLLCNTIVLITAITNKDNIIEIYNTRWTALL